MRILCYINKINSGGAERVMSVIANELSARGHKVDLVTDYRTGNEYALSPAVTRYCLSGELGQKAGTLRKLFRSFQRVRTLRKIVRTDEIDVVVSFMKEANCRGIAACRRGVAKSVISIRNDPTKIYKSRLDLLIARRLYKRADGCVFQTEEAKGFFPPELQERARIIFNPIADAFFREDVSGEKRREIVACGRLTKQKRFDLLIKAFAAVAPEHPEFVLNIYGEGEQRAELQNLIDTHHIERVFLKGRSETISDDIKDACVYVLCSDFEGMPNALMEAMALGLPVISTDCKGGGARALLEDGVSGLLIPTGDEEALASAMRAVITDPALAERLGKNAKEKALSFRKEIVVGEWEAYLEAVINRKSAR